MRKVHILVVCLLVGLMLSCDGQHVVVYVVDWQEAVDMRNYLTDELHVTPARDCQLRDSAVRHVQHVEKNCRFTTTCKTHFTPPTPTRQNCFVGSASAVWTELATVFSSFQYIGDWPVLSSLVGGVNTFSQLVVTQFPNDVTVCCHSRPGPT